MSEQQHETVGRYFRAFGDVYLCTKYLRRTGFFMKVVEKGKEPGLIDRPVGHVADVSERAIGRTYHCIYDSPWDEKYEAHEQPCECYVCKPRAS